MTKIMFGLNLKKTCFTFRIGLIYIPDENNICKQIRSYVHFIAHQIFVSSIQIKVKLKILHVSTFVCTLISASRMTHLKTFSDKVCIKIIKSIHILEAFCNFYCVVHDIDLAFLCVVNLFSR